MGNIEVTIYVDRKVLEEMAKAVVDEMNRRIEEAMMDFTQRIGLPLDEWEDCDCPQCKAEREGLEEERCPQAPEAGKDRREEVDNYQRTVQEIEEEIEEILEEE